MRHRRLRSTEARKCSQGVESGVANPPANINGDSGWLDEQWFTEIDGSYKPGRQSFMDIIVF
ncbi:hypothetical protein TCAL_16905 [Tigriopus californicus]|uniref:Uncharacterized protein n=1 Tax=Tigriopus californicus TaxID=6832 RepID=A0A553P8B7_TIGCA|nr:hypothetical protein TCAL_16905 [Tigriopus californicus]